MLCFSSVCLCLVYSGVQHILCCVLVVCLCLVHSGVQHILCCVLVLFVFVLRIVVSIVVSNTFCVVF